MEPTSEEILAYVRERIKIYKSSDELYHQRFKDTKDQAFLGRSRRAATSARALELIEYFIVNGKESPSLTNIIQAQ